MITGMVKWFNDSKGYGFVGCEGKDYFLHYNEIKADGYRTARSGDRVTFEPELSPKGLIAKSVTIDRE